METSGGMTPTPRGWYRDPSGGAYERYFDGSEWTDQTREVTLRPRGHTGGGAAAHGAAPAGAAGDGPAPVAVLERSSLPSSPFRRRATQVATAGDVPTSAGSPPVVMPVAGSGEEASLRPRRRSLSDALGTGVSPQSAQWLLLGTATEMPHRALRTTAGPTPSGWYPDPARTGGLRFFDGTRWTARTRRALNERPRHLPSAALKLRARVLEAQDAAAVRRGPRIRRTKLVIPPPSPTPSLRARSRSGSVWGMLSTLLMVVGLLAAAVFAWQLWGTDIQNKYQQRHLEEVLSSQEATGDYGDVPVVVDQGPPATAGADPDAPAGGGPSPAHPGHSNNGDPSQSPAPTTHVRVDPDAKGDGRPVGHIRIPAIGLTRVFVLGTDEDQLALGPGLWKWGAFPGTPGNTTIAGHRTTHGAPFLKLNELEYGDRIYIDVPGEREAVYEVRGHTIASPFDVRVTQQTAGVRLTLTTCNPVGSVSERLVIQAELVEGEYAADALPRSAWRLLK